MEKNVHPVRVAILMLFVLTGLVLLTGCQNEQPLEPSTLRAVFTSDPETLNPVLAADTTSNGVLDYVFANLVKRNPDTFEYEPQLAKKWTSSADHLKFTFTLRNDVKWHDGVPFNADDVIYSYKVIMDPKTEAAFRRPQFQDVEKLEKLDDYTIRFTFKKPYFLAFSACASLTIIPKHIYDNGEDFNSHSYNRKPIGNGPYKFVTWDTNRKIVLERNEDYWDKKPAFKKIVFSIIQDQAVQLQAFKKGQLDYMTVRQIQWVKQTNTDKFNEQFDKYRYLSPGFSYIGWNGAKELFKDYHVRQALTMLVNRQKIMEKIIFGLGRVVESPFFVDGTQVNHNLKNYPFDPEQSKKLLKEAGWNDSDGDGILDKDGKKFEFTFLYPSGSTTAERIVPILKEDFSKAGIVMNIERIEWAVFLDRLDKKEFDAVNLGWSTGYEDDPYEIWHSSQADQPKGFNFISFKNSEADHLMEQARVEFDEARRNKMYGRLQEILNEQQPYTFLFANDALMVVSKRIKNIIQHKRGFDSLEWEY